MTAQVPDALTLHGERYAIVDSTGAGWWTPEAHGLHPRPLSTACWRGYVASYALVDGHLTLAALDLGDVDSTGEATGPGVIAVDARTRCEVARAAVSRSAPCVIGSDAGCHLRLAHPDLAPQHVVIGDRDSLDLSNVLVTDLSSGAMYGGASRDGWVAIDLDGAAGTALARDYDEAPPTPFRGAISVEPGDELVLPGHRVALCAALPPPAPALFGVTPTRSHMGLLYQPLAVAVPFTGGVVLGADFVRELYVHGGFAPCWKYRQVRELIFERGRLTAEHDRSAAVAAVRSELHGDPLGHAPPARLRRVFALDYGRQR